MQHRATYSPEDNKLRFYPDWTDGDFDKETLKSAGYRWASKQECYVCPRWTCTAEDAALLYVDDIGDEDYSPEERAADRAERFEGYRDRRASEAMGHADTYEAGPQTFGHQNQRRAERQAARHDRHRTKAVSQWQKAEYWQMRTAGVIANALYRSSAPVRRSRIKRLEAEQRKHEKERDQHRQQWESWERVAAMDGADILLPIGPDGYADRSAMNEAQRLAYSLANDGRYRVSFWHPDSEEANAKCLELHKGSCKFSAYDFLTDDSYIDTPFRRMSPKEFAELYLAKAKSPDEYGKRWSDHYANRLAYERAMMAADGGMAGEADIEPGGFVFLSGDWRQVQSVNKSRTTGRVTSVVVWGTSTGYTPESNYTERATKPALIKRNVERLGESAYRAPTDAEREAFTAQQKADKTAAPKAPPLINPTPEDAAKLQAVWNSQTKKGEPGEPHEMIQRRYSFLSRGDAVATYGIDANGRKSMYSKQPEVFRVRTACRFCGADSVIVLTDKPQKSLPLDWETIAAQQETAEHDTSTISAR